MLVAIKQPNECQLSYRESAIQRLVRLVVMTFVFGLSSFGFGLASPAPAVAQSEQRKQNLAKSIAEAEGGANSSFKESADWQVHDPSEMAGQLRASLDSIGITTDMANQASESFLRSVEQDDTEALTAWVLAAGEQFKAAGDLIERAGQDLMALSATLDPNGKDYAIIESMPAEMRSAVRTWIGRELVRARFYDEALPVFAEVAPAVSPDAASLLFYRGACYHALLKPKEALRDLRQLLQHEDDIPTRYARTAHMMIADIKPLKKDSLDEISRLMSDVTRRLDLGRPGEQTQKREQEIIDKLTKLIDKIEKQQQQQQQQQQSGGQGGGQGGGEGTPMQDSRIAGASGQGDVDSKSIKDQDGWGNLPPAQRQESLQQISRDLPTHYREAIEAYFRKLATQQR